MARTPADPAAGVPMAPQEAQAMRGAGWDGDLEGLRAAEMAEVVEWSSDEPGWAPGRVTPAARARSSDGPPEDAA